MQFQTKLCPVDHVKNVQWISTLKKSCFVFLKITGGVTEQEERCLQIGTLKFFGNKDLSFKKDDFFYSVL